MTNIVVSSSLGDNFVVEDVRSITGDGKTITIKTNGPTISVDKLIRNGDIYIARVEDDDLRYYAGRVGKLSSK